MGEEPLYKTTNFGVTWDSVGIITGMDQSYSLHFIDENTGFSCGSYTKLYKTTNGGYNWRQENTAQFAPGYLHGIYFYDHSTGWVLGTIGKILYTETGGSPVLSIAGNESMRKVFLWDRIIPIRLILQLLFVFH